MITYFECIVFITYCISLNLICCILLKLIYLFIFTILIWLKESFKLQMWLTIYFYEIVLAGGVFANYLLKKYCSWVLQRAKKSGSQSGYVTGTLTTRRTFCSVGYISVCQCLPLSSCSFLFWAQKEKKGEGHFWKLKARFPLEV